MISCLTVHMAGVISKCHQQLFYKGYVGLWITRIGRVRYIWDEVFFKIISPFDGMIIKKKVFLDSICHIDKNIYMFIEALEVQSSVTFELCLDEEFIILLWADIMFDSPHATNFGRMPTSQCWSLIICQGRSGRILGLWWIHLVWLAIRNLNLIHNIFEG